MPFQSEKQRRYLWANEPEIARDWTDTYGSRIRRDEGGITNVPFQAGAENHLGEQEMVTVPKYWKSGADHPETELAYITKPELDLILKADFHGSLKDGPNPGPGGVMSLNDPQTGRTGAEMSHMETKGTDPRTGQVTKESQDIRQGFIGAGGTPTTQDEINAFNKSQWDQRHLPFSQRTTFTKKSGLGNAWKKFTDWMRTVDGEVMPQSYFSKEERDKRKALRGIETIFNRKNPVTTLTNKRLQQLYQTAGVPLAEQQFFDAATTEGKDYGRSPAMIKAGELGLYSNRIGEPIGPGLRVSQTETTPINKRITPDTAESLTRSGMGNMEIANNPNFQYISNMVRPVGTQFTGNVEDYQRGLVQDVGMNQDQLDAINKQHQTNLAADEGTRDFFEWLPGKKYVEDFVGNIKGKDTTGWFSDTPTDIVYGDPTTGATTQEIQDYINSLSNIHGPIKDQTQSGYAGKNLIGIAQGGRVGYNTGGLASLWPR